MAGLEEGTVKIFKCNENEQPISLGQFTDITLG